MGIKKCNQGMIDLYSHGLDQLFQKCLFRMVSRFLVDTPIFQAMVIYLAFKNSSDLSLRHAIGQKKKADIGGRVSELSYV